MAKGLRQVLGVGVLTAAGYALWRAIEANRSSRDSGWEAQPFPFPPQPRDPKSREPRSQEPPATVVEEVVEAIDGACPASHPVKATRSSRIYHVPGGASYERTHADRCYLDAASAEADGLRPAKR